MSGARHVRCAGGAPRVMYRWASRQDRLIGLGSARALRVPRSGVWHIEASSCSKIKPCMSKYTGVLSHPAATAGPGAGPGARGPVRAFFTPGRAHDKLRSSIELHQASQGGYATLQGNG